MSPTINRFRFLLVEDELLGATAAWIRRCIPGTCDLVFADCFLEAWKRIVEEAPYDGLILDVRLPLHPIGSQGKFPGYFESQVLAVCPELDNQIDNESGEWIMEGGLWLWALAHNVYRKQRATPPTIFFTAHGEKFGTFLQPLKWAQLAFWCSKNAAEGRDVFQAFLDAVRCRLFERRFFANLARKLDVGMNLLQKNALAGVEESGGWSLAALFPEYDPASDEVLSPTDRAHIREQLHQVSQLAMIKKLFHGAGAPFEVITHSETLDPQNIPNWPDCLIALDVLHQDIREEIRRQIVNIGNASSGVDAREQAQALTCFLREEGPEKLLVPKNRQETIRSALNVVRQGWNDQRANLCYREDVMGNADHGDTDKIMKAITTRLLQEAGALFRLAEACRGFFVPYFYVYPPQADVLRVNLFDTSGKWEPTDLLVPSWEVPEDKVPVSVTLTPMAV